MAHNVLTAVQRKSARQLRLERLAAWHESLDCYTDDATDRAEPLAADEYMKRIREGRA